jgi:hypothetical protein
MARSCQVDTKRWFERGERVFRLGPEQRRDRGGIHKSILFVDQFGTETDPAEGVFIDIEEPRGPAA